MADGAGAVLSALRLLIAEKRLLPDGRLPPVLPVVLYNGEARWAAPLDLRDLVGLPAGSVLWRWQPAICYHPIDEGAMDEADLASRAGLVPLLFRLENSPDPQRVVAIADALIAAFAGHPELVALRAVFVELLAGALGPLAPGVRVPAELLEVRNMLAARMEAWKRQTLFEAEQLGLQKGRQQGRKEGEAAVLVRQLERRFGALPAWARERIAGADQPTLETWSLRILDARRLEDVLT